MKKSFLRAALLLGLWGTGLALPAFAVNNSGDKIVFWSSPRQRELWWCAGGTVAGAQLYQALGMERGPAIVYSFLQTAGVALGQVYLKSESYKANTLAMDGLGLLIGTLVNVNIHFDYPHRQVKGNPYVEEIPALP